MSRPLISKWIYCLSRAKLKTGDDLLSHHINCAWLELIYVLKNKVPIFLGFYFFNLLSLYSKASVYPEDQPEITVQFSKLFWTFSEEVCLLHFLYFVHTTSWSLLWLITEYILWRSVYPFLYKYLSQKLNQKQKCICSQQLLHISLLIQSLTA